MSSGGPAVLTGGARRHRGVLQTVTLPSPNGGFPGALHDVSDDDVVALLTGRNGYHFGLPPAVTIDFPADHRPYPRLTDSSGALVVGDTYFTTAGTVITRSLGVPGYLPTLVADLLDKLGRLAASRAVSVIGVLPLAWKVPPPRSAPMPQPAHVRGKRPVNPYIGVLAQKDACMTTKISILKRRSGGSMAYVVTFSQPMATGRR